MKALTVDDSDDYREIIEALLKKNGFEVTSAKNGSEAMALLDGRENEFKLIVVDYDMPIMNGKVFIENIKRNGQSTSKIILLTGEVKTEDLCKFISKYTNTYYVSKNVPLSVLKRVLVA